MNDKRRLPALTRVETFPTMVNLKAVGVTAGTKRLEER
jgi:hypothetical protein